MLLKPVVSRVGYRKERKKKDRKREKRNKERERKETNFVRVCWPFFRNPPPIEGIVSIGGSRRPIHSRMIGATN